MLSFLNSRVQVSSGKKIHVGAQCTFLALLFTAFNAFTSWRDGIPWWTNIIVFLFVFIATALLLKLTSKQIDMDSYQLPKSKSSGLIAFALIAALLFILLLAIIA